MDRNQTPPKRSDILNLKEVRKRRFSPDASNDSSVSQLSNEELVRSLRQKVFNLEMENEKVYAIIDELIEINEDLQKQIDSQKVTVNEVDTKQKISKYL